jgi:hypothetical protein
MGMFPRVYVLWQVQISVFWSDDYKWWSTQRYITRNSEAGPVVALELGDWKNNCV